MVLQPRVELNEYVRRILVTTGDERTDEPMPIVPTGFAYFTYTRYPVEFQYSYRKYRTSDRLYLVGQLEHEKPWFRIRGRFFQVGLELYPLVPFYAFGIPGEDLTDKGFSKEALTEITGGNIADTIYENDSPETVANKLQAELLKLMNNQLRQPLLEKCLGMIYAAGGNISMAELIERLESSERNLRRQFRKYVGLGIKKYLKTVQFNTVFETIRNGNREAIYKTALEYGFYDHAHFINQFKERLGASPQKFINNPDPFLINYLGNSAQNRL